jgi:hypothetical protein
MLTRLLNDVVLDNRNPQKLFDLAKEYDKLEQGAAAFTFYMRAAEFNAGETFEEKWIQYKSLIRMALIHERERNRDVSVDSLLKSAISVLPDRPEGYYVLSKLCSEHDNWRDAHLYSKIGLQCLGDYQRIDNDIDYPGAYGLKYIYAISYWKDTGTDFAKNILFDFKYKTRHDKAHEDKIDQWISQAGYPHSVPYTKKDFEHYKFPFLGLEDIEKNHSRHYQDLFVLSILNGKRNGKFVELGSGDPYKFNNTALLEDKFGWSGISIDNDEKHASEFTRKRKSTMILADAGEIDYSFLFKSNCVENYVDFLRFNSETTSLKALEKMPLNKYEFGIIQFQHNACWWGDEFRNKSREILEKAGYFLMGNDIATSEVTNYEDWWVHPEIAKNKREMISDKTKFNFALEYMMKEHRT